VKVVEDLPRYNVGMGLYHSGIEDPCMTIHGESHNICYTHHGDVSLLHGMKSG
jgi:hypothetical protein